MAQVPCQNNVLIDDISKAASCRTNCPARFLEVRMALEVYTVQEILDIWNGESSMMPIIRSLEHDQLPGDLAKARRNVARVARYVMMDGVPYRCSYSDPFSVPKR